MGSLFKPKQIIGKRATLTIKGLLGNLDVLNRGSLRLFRA